MSLQNTNEVINLEVPITDITDIIIHDLDVIKTPNKPGNLVNLNLNKIKTKYNFKETAQFYLNDLSSLRGRGRHSNINVREIIVCVSGRCTISLFNCYEKKHVLITKNQAVFIPNNVWIDMYNFKKCVLLVLVEHKNCVIKDTPMPVKESIYNLTEYLNFNNIYSKFRNIYFKDYLIIEHIITIFWTEPNNERYIHTKNMFKYYNDLRNLLFYSHNILLNFTIVGSNGECSLQLYENNLKCDNGIFNDIYIEYNQQSKYPKDFMKMLHDKWLTGFNASLTKTSDIVVMRGSNDIVEPKIYVQIKEQYYKDDPSKLYIATKSIPHINLTNVTLIIPTTFSKLEQTICYTNNKNKIVYFDNQYDKRIYDIDFVASIGTIAFIGMTPHTWKHLLSHLDTNPAAFNLAHEIELEMYIRRNITNKITLTQNTFFLNIKSSNDITSLEAIQASLPNASTLLLSELPNYIRDTSMNSRINYMLSYFDSNDTHKKPQLLEKMLACDYTLINNELIKQYYNAEGDLYATGNKSIMDDVFNFTGVRFTMPNST